MTAVRIYRSMLAMVVLAGIGIDSGERALKH